MPRHWNSTNTNRVDSASLEKKKADGHWKKQNSKAVGKVTKVTSENKNHASYFDALNHALESGEYFPQYTLYNHCTIANIGYTFYNSFQTSSLTLLVSISNPADDYDPFCYSRLNCRYLGLINNKIVLLSIYLLNYIM